MKTINTKTILITTVVLAAAFAQAHVEPGSFLNKPARTVNALIAQTEHDGQVMDRYQRHFQMSKSDLITYFMHLHVDRLRKTGSYVVYNCHDDEVIRARVFHLKAGTPVFADETGRPILKIACGNPMVAPTPKVVIVEHPREHPHEHMTPPPPPMPPVPPVIICPPAPAPAPIPVPAPPVVNNTTSTVTNNTTKNYSSSSLFFLPVLLIFNNHGHSVCHTQKQPVPEPASLLIMGVGAATMFIRKRKNS